MRQQALLNDARDLLANLVYRIKGATAMRHVDINVISESVLLPIFREVFSLPHLRNLNRDHRNFPGLDLGDDVRGHAFQVTATADLEKVKDTLRTVLSAGLETKYPRVQVYVLIEKNASYSQSAIDKITENRMAFDSGRDILDFRDLLRACADLPVEGLQRVVELLRRQLALGPTPEGVEQSRLALPSGVETVQLNLVPIWFPNRLYVADFIEPEPVRPPSSSQRSRRPKSRRELVVAAILDRGYFVPEDFEIRGDQIISFHDPSDRASPLCPYVDVGTLLDDLPPKAYYSADGDQLNTFKSLLRRALQRQLRPEKVHWQRDYHLFFYGPDRGFEDRIIGWRDERLSERTVFQRTMKSNKPDEVLTCKHLAFYVDFHLIDGSWFMAVMPTWYFSRDGHAPDHYGSKRISWLKKKENDQQVHTHFRFLNRRMQELQESSLFEKGAESAIIQIGEPVSFANHPYLPDSLWNPRDAATDESQGRLDL